MNQPPLDIQLSPNFTPGRQGTPVRKITFHHVVGTAASAVSKFKNPASQTSTHFVVASNKIYCCVDTDDTAYANANWPSNLESVTIEHEGTWLNGFRDQGVIDQSAILVAWLRSLYPNATPNRHRDVYPTACPGDLPVEEIWNRATGILNPPKPPAPIPLPAPKLTVTDVQNRIVVVSKDTDLWDLSFTTWTDAKSVKKLPKGTELEISAVALHPLGGQYYLTEYSFAKGINNGVNVKDCAEKPAPPTPVPPTPTPIPPTPEPPKPSKDDEQDSRLNVLEKAVKAIQDFLSSIFNGFKK